MTSGGREGLIGGIFNTTLVQEKHLRMPWLNNILAKNARKGTVR